MRNNLRWMRVLGTQRVYLISRRPLGARRCAGAAAGAGAVHTLACPEVAGQKTASARRAAAKPCSSLRPSRRRRCSDDIRPTRGRAPRLVARRLAGPPQFTASMVASRIFLPQMAARSASSQPGVGAVWTSTCALPDLNQIRRNLLSLAGKCSRTCLWLVWWPLAIF